MKGLIHKKLIPIYNEMLYVTFDKEAALNKLGVSDGERLIYKNSDGLAFDGLDHKGGRIFLIYVEKKNDCISVSTVSHECFHIADMLLEVKGMEYKPESGNEHIAYLVGYLVERVFNCLDLDNQYYNALPKTK